MNNLEIIFKKIKFVFLKIIAQIKLYSLKYNVIKKLHYYLIKANQKSKFLKPIKKILRKNSYSDKFLTRFKKSLESFNLLRLTAHGPSRFGGDVILSSIIDEIIEFFKVTSFIETGTYLGSTSANMAKLYPKLPIFTCEVNKTYYKIAKEGLKKYRNVQIENNSSELFLAKLIKKKKSFTLPLIFLDAHWYDFLPLPIEIELISTNLNKSIIVIHDFEVPNKPEYASDISNRMSTQPIACNLSLIEDKLKNKKNYRLLFPNYTLEASETSALTGYVVIFQNLTESFEIFKNEKFVQDHFLEYNIT